jgi:hypothetical protein
MSEFSEDRSPVADNAVMDISPGPPWKQGKPTVDSDDDEIADAVGNLSISPLKMLQVYVCSCKVYVCVLRMNRLMSKRLRRRWRCVPLSLR